MTLTLNKAGLSAYKAPAGGRRPVMGDAKATYLIETYAGLGGRHKEELLATFKRARRLLGLSRSAEAVYEYLFQCCQTQDWNKNSLAIAWPSNEDIMAKTGVADKKSLQRHFRALRRHGLIGYKDSPTRKRYGFRDGHRRIILAKTFGIVMNPIAGMLEDLKALIAKDDALRARKKHLTRLKTSIKRRAEDLEALFQDVLSDDKFLQLQRLIIKAQLQYENADSLDSQEHILSRLAGLLNRISKQVTYFEAFMDCAYRLPSLFKYKESRPVGGLNTPSIRTSTRTFSTFSNGLASGSNESEAPQTPWDKGLKSIKTEKEKGLGAEAERKKVRRLKRLLPDTLTYRLNPLALYTDLYPILRPAILTLGLKEELIDRCRLAMGISDTCAVLTILINKEPEIRNLGAYLGGMIEKHRLGELNIGRSLYGIEANKRRIGRESEQASMF